jgi:hypothetical protein
VCSTRAPSMAGWTEILTARIFLPSQLHSSRFRSGRR